MKKDVFTIGKEERNIVLEWFLRTRVTSLKQARFMIAVQGALDEIQEDFEVVEGKEYKNQIQKILHIAYDVATGKVQLNDVFEDRTQESTGIYKIISTNSGLAIVNI